MSQGRLETVPGTAQLVPGKSKHRPQFGKTCPGTSKNRPGTETVVPRQTQHRGFVRRTADLSPEQRIAVPKFPEQRSGTFHGPVLPLPAHSRRMSDLHTTLCDTGFRQNEFLPCSTPPCIPNLPGNCGTGGNLLFCLRPKGRNRRRGQRRMRERSDPAPRWT